MESRKWRGCLMIAAGLILLCMTGLGFGAIEFMDYYQKYYDPETLPEGSLAPNFVLATPNRQHIALDRLRGQPVLINFWATWCPPCRAETPDIQAVHEKYKNHGLVILAVNGGETADEVLTFAEEFEVSFILLLDPNGIAAEQFQIYAYPTTYFIDRQGIIKKVQVGSLSQSEMEKIIDSLLMIE
jgi:peroxiredoxin